MSVIGKMLAAKFCLSNSLSSYPTLMRTSKLITKTYNTLNCRINLLSHSYKATQTLKIINKPKIKFELFNRTTTTTTTTTTVITKSVDEVRKQVGVWLLCCSGMVFGAITLGGYTRLTESGLSMVTWRFTYESHPKTEEDWLAEFEKYKEFPEFKLLKKDITLEEFKKIWMTEFAHRNWGRFIGFTYFLPAALFWMRGCFKPVMKKRITFFGFLIVMQGLLGWYMVKSGLEDRFHKETDVPRVSQYRLAAHLGLALTLYTGLFLTALDLLLPAQKVALITKGAQKVRMLAHTCKGLVFLTALSGAFVAGLDAGLVYNSFPKMGDNWIPDDILALSPKLKNFTENPTTVQFDHRILGIATFAAIIATWFVSKKHSVPKRAKLAANVLVLAALAQVTLGISTLVHYVPVSLAITHQSGSVVLLTAATWLSHELKLLKHIPK